MAAPKYPHERPARLLAVGLALAALIVVSGCCCCSAHEVSSSAQTVNLELKQSTLNKGLLYGQLTIGSSVNQDQEAQYKPQTFNLLICTASHTTWVPSDQLAHLFGHVYTARPSWPGAADSSGSSSTLLAYGSGLLNVSLQRDQLQLGGPAGPARPADVHLAPFWVAHAGSKFGRFPARPQNLDGVLGLNYLANRFGQLSPHPHNLVGHLREAGRISHRVASLYIAAAAGGGGLLTLGGLDSDHFTGEVAYAPMVGHPGAQDAWHLESQPPRLDWGRVQAAGRKLDKYMLEFERFVEEEGEADNGNGGGGGGGPRLVQLSLDSSTTKLVGDVRYLDLYLIEFMGARRFGLAGNYVFDDCRLDNKPDFVFKVKGTTTTTTTQQAVGGSGNSTTGAPHVELRLEPKDYVFEYEHLNGRKYCLAAFLGLETRGEWTLGTSFLRNYYTVFDYDRHLVGFARPQHH